MTGTTKLRLSGWILFAVGIIMVFVSTNDSSLNWLRWAGIGVSVVGMVLNGVGILIQSTAIFRKKPPTQEK